MFRKFIWKFFPPKFVSQEEVDYAHEIFDNVRYNYYSKRQNHDGYITPYDVMQAEDYFTHVLRKRSRYLEYVGVSK